MTGGTTFEQAAFRYDAKARIVIFLIFITTVHLIILLLASVIEFWESLLHEAHGSIRCRCSYALASFHLILLNLEQASESILNFLKVLGEAGVE